MTREPRLLFTQAEIDALIARRKADAVGRDLFAELLAAANWCRKQPVLPQPDPGPDKLFREGPFTPGTSPYSDEYLLCHEAFEVLTFAFERSVQQMSLMYRLTGEERWAEGALAWLDAAMNSWQAWGPQSNRLDQFAVRIINSTALGCDWLGEAVPARLLAQCRRRVSECAEQCLGEWGASLDRSEPHQLSNHYWFNVGMLGMATLWLGFEEPAWREVADRCGRQLERLSEWAIGPDGDYNDKPGYLLYSFRWALPFLMAWHHAGGPDVVSRPRFGAAAQWLCDMLVPGELNLMDTPWGFFDRWIYLLLAAKQSCGRAQWVGLNTTDAPYVRHEPTWLRWMHNGPAWAHLFYDESVPATPPEALELEPGRWYRWSGWAVLEPDGSASTPTVVLHAGPASGKNYHNQGQLLVSAYGDRLLQIPEQPNFGYLSEHRAIAFLMSNLSGEVLTADGLGQASGHYPNEWPGVEVFGHALTPPVGQIVSVDSGPGWSAATADLTAAYQGFGFQGMWGVEVTPLPEWEGKRGDRLARFLRHILLLGTEWVILLDEVTPHLGQSVDLEWRFGTHANVTLSGPREALLETGRAALEARLMRPEDCAFSIQRAHFSETGKWLTVKAPGCTRDITLLLTMRVRRRGPGTGEFSAR
jgi:hypothetical protein